jgi:uncharacterized surface protein with fasciclin (FAS1) repeats
MTAAAVLTLTAGAAIAQTAAPAAPATPAAAAAPAAAPAATPAATNVVANGDIVQTLKLAGQFNTFAKAADATNLTGLLKNNKGLTVFAPTDAAFAALPAGELDKLMADKPRLQKLITYHIINAPVDSAKIKGHVGAVPTVAGSNVELDGAGDVLKVNNADIIQADVRASNGIVHVIDKVLTPGAPTAGGADASASATTPAPASAAPSTPK